MPNNDSSDAPEDNPAESGNLPTPSEVLAIILASLKHYLNATQERPKWTDEAMVVLTFFVALGGFASVIIFEGQLREAQRATNLTAQQWQAERVPWVGLDNDLLKIEAELKPDEGGFGLTYSVKNVGTQPALYESESVQALKTEDVPYPEAVKYFDDSCRGRLQPQPNRIGDWRMVLPGAAIPGQFTRIHPVGGFVEPQQIKQMWLFVCVIYFRNDIVQGRPMGTEHHSRYWFITDHNWKAESAQVPGHKLTYLPIIGVTLKRADAD